MEHVMETLALNLRKAFPKLPAEIFESNESQLSDAYLKKCATYFDLETMYPKQGEVLQYSARKVGVRPGLRIVR